MAERELEFTTRLTREDVAGLIEALVEGMKDGHLRVQKSNETLELEVPRVVDLEIEAKVSDERAKFEIEVSWRTNRAKTADIDFPEQSPGTVFHEQGAQDEEHAPAPEASPQSASSSSAKQEATLPASKSAQKPRPGRKPASGKALKSTRGGSAR